MELPDDHPVWSQMTQYEPFATEASEEVVFKLQVVAVDTFPADGEVSVEVSQDDDGSQIVATVPILSISYGASVRRAC